MTLTRCPVCKSLTGPSGVCPVCGWWDRNREEKPRAL